MDMLDLFSGSREHAYHAVANRCFIGDPVGGDKPSLQLGGFPLFTTIAEILGTIYNSRAVSVLTI